MAESSRGRPPNMSEVLFIKTSSLGDVIHHMPAMTEVRRNRPHARVSWVVEEAFAPLARLHAAVDVVIPVASDWTWTGSEMPCLDRAASRRGLTPASAKEPKVRGLTPASAITGNVFS